MKITLRDLQIVYLESCGTGSGDTSCKGRDEVSRVFIEMIEK